jgi:hypothetical protein
MNIVLVVIVVIATFVSHHAAVQVYSVLRISFGKRIDTRRIQLLVGAEMKSVGDFSALI